jgi:hypothetical protein
MDGLRIDDLSAVSSLPAALRPIATQLKKELSPLGVVSVADYSLVRKSVPINSVTVRVFIFDTVDNRRQWCQKKYEYEGWQKDYKNAGDTQAMRVLDSLQSNKRVYQFEKVLMTSHQLSNGAEHHKAALQVLEQLTTPEGSKAND